MVTIRSFFLSFFLLFLHLPSFTPSLRLRRRRRNSSASALKTSFISFFKRLFSSSTRLSPQPPPPPPPLRSPSSSTRSFRLNSTIFPDVHPCSACGEVFRTPQLLEHHRSVRHPISELDADDENIIRIIFKTGWPAAKTPKIHRILKIHNTSTAVSLFEEHRERVKSRAAAAARRDERCAADGNELLRFHCATFVCSLSGGGGAACGRAYCSLCGIIASGFSPKMDGISTLPTSYAAHAAVPEEMEAEFGFMNVKRAVLVCRVIAGRVGCDPCEADKEDPGFDSLAGRGGDEEEDDEILVFNPRAVLPCFVVLYTVVD